MIKYGHGTVAFALTCISLVHILLAVFISFLIVTIIVYQQICHRVKRVDKVILVLSALIYFLIFVYAIILSATNIQTLLGDVYGTHFDSAWCRLNGYLITVIVCAMYNIFVIQVRRRSEYSINVLFPFPLGYLSSLPNYLFKLQTTAVISDIRDWCIYFNSGW